MARHVILPLPVIACVIFGATNSCNAQPKPVDFGRDVFGVLRKACFECHGPEKQEGELRLDRRSDLFDSGTVVSGNPADSELLRRITLPRSHEEIMPAIGEPLSKREISRIRRWIQQGADWPESFQAERHWSYVTPKRPALPELLPNSTVPAGWRRNPVDDFVAARLTEEGLSPSHDADPETLVRRTFLDLTGLPPSPAEVDAFVASPSDENYEKLVDELLSRPQFGERWARPWLDLARYADSHGFQRDNLRDIWAYRDWVIQALNDDMPFDRFTLEQIAGDLLPNATESQKIATGFHRCTPTNVEAGSLPEETRTEQVIDRVNTTGAVWLGTTLECCQCHDHKYDPFSMKDYYRLLAFFNSTEAEADRANPKSPSSIKFNGPKMVISNREKDGRRDELKKQQEQLTATLAKRRKVLAKGLNTWVGDFTEKRGELPETHVLDVVRFQSTGQKDAPEFLDDGSILLAGKNPPDKDVYKVTVKTGLQDIAAFQLEALTHKSLPGTGPGRGDRKKTNFVLNEFSASLSSGDESTPLKFQSAIADFSQNNWDVNGALKTAAKTGWAIAPQFGKSHWAKFILSERLNCDGEQHLTFELKQEYGAARSIGCLRLSAITGNLAAESVSPEIAAIMKKSPTKWSAEERKKLLAFRISQDSESNDVTAELDDLKQQLNTLEPDTTLVMIELAKPRMSYVYDRGDYRKQGDKVKPGTPETLHPMPDGPANRITLARWLTDPSNPLVARVTVNRWWAEIFGTGIVSTVEDFGIKGEAPSHQELLDWLAVEFMENGWSMKKLLRTIVLSSTYRQSSAISEQLRQQDDKNRLLARGPRFRMDAEMIRDNILAASGLLSLKQFGPSIRPYQPDGIWSKVGGNSYKYEVSPGSEQYRRGIYVVLKRGAPYPSFINFDASARLSCTVQRSRTNTPLQALTLLNDPVYVDAAKALARRVLTEKKTATAKEQLSFAFQLCTARKPGPEESGVLLDLLETQKSVNLARPQQARSYAKGTKLPPDVDEATFAAWCSVASTLINLHETITKN